jgi:hypothetical protein
MQYQQSVSGLLEDIVKDNPTFKFPIETINKELMSLFLEPMEFDYFIIQSFRKLKRDFGDVIAHIFLQTLELKLNMKPQEVANLTLEEYHSYIEIFISALENIYITRIDRNSSDGEMLSVMG